MYAHFKRALQPITQKGSFAQNFAVTLSSNVIALGIGFAFTPIIARIYSPEAYGIFGLFTAISQNVGNIATLQFTRGFVIPKEESDFHDLVRITFISSIFFSVLSLLLFLIAGDFILALFNAEKLGNWIYLIPIAVLFSSMNDIWRSWNIRAKEFKRGASAKLISTVTTRLFTLIYGISTAVAAPGLVLGDFFSKPIDSYSLRSRSIKKKSKIFFNNYKLDRLKKIAKDYKSYPAYVLPGNWLNNFSGQLPVYLLMGSFSASVVGYYSQANSLLNIPMTVLATAIAPVFLQKAAETFRNNPNDMQRLVKSLYNRLFYLGVIPFCILIVFGDKIFTIFLGDRWETAGVFAGYMGFYFLFWIISSPLNSLYRIYAKEHWNLTANVVIVGLKGIGILIGILQNDYLNSILYFSIATVLGHIFHIWLCFKLVKLNYLPYLLKSVFSVLVIFFTLFILKSTFSL